MNFINWGGESPDHLAVRKQLEEQALYEQAIRMAQARQRVGQTPGAVGGGSVAGARAIKISAKNNTIGYYDEVTGNLVFFNADWDSVSFSDTADSGIPYADIDYWDFDRLIDGKGVLARVNMSNDDCYYLFIDAGCNIIETVHLISGSTYGISSNRVAAEGLAIQLSYRNDSGRIIKWWCGDEIFTRTDTTIRSNSDNFMLDWYGFDDAFSDGTTTAFIDDLDLGYARVFHCRPNGQFLEVTSALRANGTAAQDSYLHCIGDFAISLFMFDTAALAGTADYDSESFEVTLKAPVTGLRRGMRIRGGAFDDSTVITAISGDGLTVTISILPNSTDSDVPVQFGGSFVELIRVVLADGTYSDFDVSEYEAAYHNSADLFGSNKAVFSLFRSFDSTVVWIIYNHANLSIKASDPVNYNTSYELYNIDQKRTFYSSVRSVAGCERFLGAQVGESSWDGKMYTYTDFTFIWSNPTGELFTYTFDTDRAPVGFSQSGAGYGDPMYVVINSPESRDLEIMRFDDDGTVDISSLGTAYGDWTGYLGYGALGDKTWISWKDASLGDKIQVLQVLDGGGGPASPLPSQIQITDANNGAQVGKTQFISDYVEGVTYLFDYNQNGYYTISDTINNWVEFKSNSYQNAINFETLSNVVLFPPDNSFILVNPDLLPPVKLEDGEGLAFRGSSEYAVKLSEDAGPGGFIRISVYTYGGTLVNSVLTQATNYENFEVVNERIFLSQNPTGNTWHFYIITPNEDGYVFKEITVAGGINYVINSWGWWD